MGNLIWAPDGTCPVCCGRRQTQFNVITHGGVEIRRVRVRRTCPNHCTHDQILEAERQATEEPTDEAATTPLNQLSDEQLVQYRNDQLIRLNEAQSDYSSRERNLSVDPQGTMPQITLSEAKTIHENLQSAEEDYAAAEEEVRRRNIS